VYTRYVCTLYITVSCVYIVINYLGYLFVLLVTIVMHATSRPVPGRGDSGDSGLTSSVHTDNTPTNK
jgi:hypothetical protein